MKRPEQAGSHGMDHAAIDRMLSGLAAIAEAVDVHFQGRPQLSDAKDEMVLEAAVNGRADALITHNVRDFQPAAGQFDLLVLRPREFLERMVL